MHRSTTLIGAVALVFLLFKVLRFTTLGYTFNDMYAFLQMSYSWLDGRPFMYDNIWGFHHRIHNYYTVLLWGPLCYVAGAYGFFLVQALLLGLSYAVLNERLAREVPPWVRYGLLVAVLLGPVSFWLNDHPNIGWHTELTYLPAAILFALALTGTRLWPKLLSGLAVVLVKEDGAVLAALIHLAYSGIQFVRRQPARSLLWWLGSRSFWLIAVGWSLVFLAGMWWISFKNNFAEPRLRMALQLVADHIATWNFWKQMLTLMAQTALLLVPVPALLLYWQWVNRIRKQGNVWLLYGAGIAVLTALNFVQSAHYYGQPLFHLVALTWPPRFVLLWAFSVAFLILFATGFAPLLKPDQGKSPWLVMAVLFLIQIPILYGTRPDFPTLKDWAATLRGRFGTDKNSIWLHPDDLAVVQCLAGQLPAHSSVLAFDYLVPYFHRHYGIWPTGNELKPADMAIIPNADPQGLRTAPGFPKTYRQIPLKAYTVYVAPAYEAIARSCLR
ncbi:hypothetical protein GCM10023189_33650 [Nibrella saemangeumensis]|uniref:4-amino-4-deoxy-L-arabinose transferase n=1 Tax=Nibrella saemangeumensis TaxID=1084526 RepID=A0ABP8N416_9BACT